MKGGNHTALLVKFVPSNGALRTMRLIQMLPVTPADPTQAIASQLIRLQEPIPEYGREPAKGYRLL